MIVFENKNNYIAGIFDLKYAASNFLKAVPEGIRKDLISYEVEGLNYPFCIVEDHNYDKGQNKFSFTSRGQAMSLIWYKMIYRPDDYSLAVYTITQDYCGDLLMLGTDYMGTLDHVHFDAKDPTYTKAELEDLGHWGYDRKSIQLSDGGI